MLLSLYGLQSILITHEASQSSIKQATTPPVGKHEFSNGVCEKFSLIINSDVAI